MPHHRRLIDELSQGGPNSIHLCGDQPAFPDNHYEPERQCIRHGVPVDFAWWTMASEVCYHLRRAVRPVPAVRPSGRCARRSAAHPANGHLTREEDGRARREQPGAGGHAGDMRRNVLRRSRARPGVCVEKEGSDGTSGTSRYPGPASCCRRGALPGRRGRARHPARRGKCGRCGGVRGVLPGRAGAASEWAGGRMSGHRAFRRKDLRGLRPGNIACRAHAGLVFAAGHVADPG